MTPRPYQERAHDETIAALADNPVLVAPTGSGKTFTATRIIKTANRPTLWLAHRRELIDQAADSLRRYGLDVGLIMAGEPANPNAQVQVASVQTIVRRLDRLSTRADLLVIDEAHHVRATSYARIVAAFPDASILGLTATPFRLDGRGLGTAFGRIIVAATTAELVADGTLLDPVVYAPADPNLKGIRRRGGDYAVGELGDRMGDRKLVGDIVLHWSEHGRGRRTVCFAVNVAHSQAIVAAFRAAGVVAEHLDGATPQAQRDAILHRLRIGYTAVVSQCQVLTEGWDLPALEVAIVARPTAALCLHLQMIGRIMRTADDKRGALVLDHAGNHLRHGFVTQALTYSLDDREAGATPAPTADGGDNGRRCTRCYLLVLGRPLACPGCGAAFPVEIPETEAGTLERLGARPTIEDQQTAWDRIDARRIALEFAPRWSLHEFKRRFGFTPLVRDGVVLDPEKATGDVKRALYRKLSMIQRARGYKRGWVSFQFKAVFGHWPRF